MLIIDLIFQIQNNTSLSVNFINFYAAWSHKYSNLNVNKKNLFLPLRVN